MFCWKKPGRGSEESSGFCTGQTWLSGTLQSARGLAEGITVWSMSHARQIFVQELGGIKVGERQV